MTDYGLVNAVADEVRPFQKRINAEDIMIFADVQVKHSKMVDKNKTLTESINQAKKYNIDALIVTGKWTGDAPNVEDLKESQKASDGVPVIIGSGVDEHNIGLLKLYVDGYVVGTSLKEGSKKSKEEQVNIKGYDKRVNLGKVKKLVNKNRIY